MGPDRTHHGTMRTTGLYLEFSPIIIRQIRHHTTDRELVVHLNEIAKHIIEVDRRGSKTVAVVDLSRAPRMTVVQRKMYSDWLAQHHHLFERVNVGTAFVARSQLIRAGLATVLWMRPPPNGHVVTLSLSEAVEWGIGRLREHGIEPPDRLVHDRSRALLSLGSDFPPSSTRT